MERQFQSSSLNFTKWSWVHAVENFMQGPSYGLSEILKLGMGWALIMGPTHSKVSVATAPSSVSHRTACEPQFSPALEK